MEERTKDIVIGCYLYIMSWEVEGIHPYCGSTLRMQLV